MILLRKNGKNIDDSVFESFFSGPSGHISDIGILFQSIGTLS